MVRSNIQYTATGKVASESRPNGLSLNYTYYAGNDRLEMLTETMTSGSQITRWTYLATGEVQSITTAEGTPEATTLTFNYDNARRLTRITDDLGHYMEYTLDTEGNREAENIHDSLGVLRKSLGRTFDIYNRQDVTTQANESMDDDFAADGTLNKQTDGEGRVTEYSYDALQRLLTSTQDINGLAALTQYGYDADDNLISVVDPINGATSYVYDDLGNLLQTTSPDTGTTAYTYDAAGNLKTRQDALGQLFIYTYDALNRLTGVDAPGTDDDITFGYDSCTNGTGRLCSVITAGTTVTYAYDGFGNIASHQQLAYTFDAANRLKTITYPSGAIVTYSHDAAGQVSQVDLTADGATTTLASAISHAPFGGVESLSFGNGVPLSQYRDTAYRLTAQLVPGALDLGYTLYDGNGNLKTRTDTFSSTSAFAYDALDRLDIASGAFGSRDYGYDLNGNRTGLDDGTLTSYSYETQSNRLSQVGSAAVLLDVAGNTLSKGTWTYTYTPHHRLDSARDDGQLVATYAYNGLGQRVSKDSSGAVTRFLYGTDGALMAELDVSGGVQREYIYLNAQLLAVLNMETVQSGGGEVIIDNGQAGTGSTGSWTGKTGSQDYGTDYLLANRNNKPSSYRWTPGLTVGTYEVYAWWVSNNKYSSNVPYTIGHNGQTDTVYRDHTASGGSWQLLGTYDFNGQGGEYVEVSNANGKATADAIKFVGQVTTTTQSRIYYVHNDHLGTPQAMTDGTGAVVWRATYDPFGEATIAGVSTVELNVRFPGQYYDQETGLHYNYFRYYDPETGRYITSDPIGLLGSLNTYAYVGGKPTSFIDPLGLYDVFIGGGGDSFSAIVRSYRGDFAREFSDRKTDYFGWGDSAGILDAIRSTRRDNPCAPINLIGHSWGGDTAVDVAAALNADGINVDSLATIDPVSWPWSRSAVGENVNQWINVSSAPSSSNGFAGDAWARIGGKWNSGYPAPFHHNEFGAMMDWTPPRGQSPRNILLNSNSGCMCQ